MRKIVHSTVDATHLDFWEIERTPRANPFPRLFVASPLIRFHYIMQEYGIRVRTRKLGPKAAIAYFHELLSAAKRAA